MATVIGICNTALSRLGIDQAIEDLNDSNARARACRLHYDQCRQQVLQDFPWNFARGVVALAELSTDPPPGFGYSYRYPTDCLEARIVTDEAGYRLRNQWEHDVRTWSDWGLWSPGRVTFEVMADTAVPGSRLIACDIPEAHLWYTVDVSITTQFTPLFASALAWRIAAELAGALRVDARLRQSAMQEYLWAVSQAQASSLNEAQTDRYPESPSIQVRA